MVLDRPEPDHDGLHAPLVTVVVPVYNHAQYVRECLNSIIASTYPNIEIIVVNDASSDESSEVISNWIEQHPAQEVLFIDHTENRGLTKSLNEAIRCAHGIYFTHIAGDDVMLPNGIADRVNWLVHHPTKLAVFADCHVVNDTGEVLFESAIEGLLGGSGMQKRELVVDDLVPYNIVFHWALPCGAMFLARMCAFDKVGRYNEHYIVEDYDMYLRLASRKTIGFCNTYVAKFRKHAHNTSSVRAEKIRLESVTTARNNMNLFGPICRIRLASPYMLEKSRTANTRIGASMLRLSHKASLFVSWRAYRIKRAVLLARSAA